MAVYCPRCNTANREGSRYCNSCGAALEAPPQITCPNCGVAALAYSFYCHRCGARLPQPDIPTITPPIPITETDEESKGGAEEESDVISLDQVPLDVVRTGTKLPEESKEEIPPKGEEEVREPEIEEERPTTLAGGREKATEVTEQPPQPLGEAAIAALSPVRVRPSPGHRPPSPLSPLPRERDGWCRFSYVILLAAIIVGLIAPAGWLTRAMLPAPEVRSLFDVLEGLPEQAVVLVSFDYDTATADEMRPLAEVILQHLIQRRARLLLMSLMPQGPALAQQVIQPLSEKHVYAYGVDYINMGYLSGDEAALATLGPAITAAFGSDFMHGQSLDSFAIARGIRDISSIQLVVELAGDENGVRRWVEQVQSRYGVPLVAATSAVAMPLAFPYMQSGQVLGMANGLPAAAQYEQLLQYHGQASRGINAQTLGHVVILAFIAVGNIVLLLTRGRKTHEREK